MAAHDVMGQAVGPRLAVVVVAVSENLVGCGKGHRERVALAGRYDLEVRSIRPDPDHAAAVELDRLAVPAGRPRNPLVADREIEKAIHAQADSRGNVFVDAAPARQLRPQPGDQIDSRIGSPIAVSVAERRKKRSMDDVERLVDPLQPHDAPQVLGEDVSTVPP